jgi:hypothetical protein
MQNLFARPNFKLNFKLKWQEGNKQTSVFKFSLDVNKEILLSNDYQYSNRLKNSIVD